MSDFAILELGKSYVKMETKKIAAMKEEGEIQRAFQAGEAERQRVWQAGENEKDRLSPTRYIDIKY